MEDILHSEQTEISCGHPHKMFRFPLPFTSKDFISWSEKKKLKLFQSDTIPLKLKTFFFTEISKNMSLLFSVNGILEKWVDWAGAGK